MTFNNKKSASLIISIIVVIIVGSVFAYSTFIADSCDTNGEIIGNNINNIDICDLPICDAPAGDIVNKPCFSPKGSFYL